MAAVAAVAGCGSGSDATRRTAPSIAAIDINPQPRDRIRDGGTLRWAIERLPVQWNYNHVDGPEDSALAVLGGLIPQPFVADGKADVRPDPDYIESVKVTGDSPQTIRLVLNPRAKWSDGTPITERDYAAQFAALRGRDRAFRIASSTGYDHIRSVTEGAGDHEVIVTFARSFGEWRSLFSPLYPARFNATPRAFNTGYRNHIPVTAGPFRLGRIDRAAKTVTVVRDPNWWGAPAKLDTIVYRALGDRAGIDAFVAGAVDLVDVGPDLSAVRAIGATPGATLHAAGGPDYRHLTINGSAPNLRDVRVRRALALGIDRAAIARADLRGLDWPVRTMDNHFYVNTQAGYEDTTGDLGTPDPARARRLLDEAGWTPHGAYRRRDGRTLELRFVIPAGVAISRQEAELTRTMLKAIGIRLAVVAVPSARFFDAHVIPGRYDIAPFSWLGSPFPISPSRAIYAKPTRGSGGRLQIDQNFARVGSRRIDRLLDRAAQTADDTRARAITNRADGLIWREVHSLILYQRPQITATRSTLANFGSFGFATPVFADIGWMR